MCRRVRPCLGWPVSHPAVHLRAETGNLWSGTGSGRRAGDPPLPLRSAGPRGAVMEFIGRTRGARRAYSFDEIALAPASTTVDPQDVDLSWSVGGHRFALPFMAAAMDSVVDPAIAIQMSEAGGLAVLNLEGIQTRYDDPTQPLERIAAAAPDEVVGVLQQLYQEPIKDQLVTARIRAIVDTGAVACVSVTPARAPHLLPLAEEAGAQLLALQSTVVTDRHHSSRGRSVSVRDLIEQVGVPVMVGSALARAEEAPGRGFHWGMATPHPALPRGTRIKVGTGATLQQILFGPAETDDGSQNLTEALRTAMGICGARTIRDMHQVEIVIAPTLASEGKALQFAQRVGQGR